MLTEIYATTIQNLETCLSDTKESIAKNIMNVSVNERKLIFKIIDKLEYVYLRIYRHCPPVAPDYSKVNFMMNICSEIIEKINDTLMEPKNAIGDKMLTAIKYALQTFTRAIKTIRENAEPVVYMKNCVNCGSVTDRLVINDQFKADIQRYPYNCSIDQFARHCDIIDSAVRGIFEMLKINVTENHNDPVLNIFEMIIIKNIIKTTFDSALYSVMQEYCDGERKEGIAKSIDKESDNTNQ